jgi:uncharacterized membrane protein YkvA (DUF1232 family)
LAAKLILPALLVYLAIPIDIIPDFIPVLGHLDDVLIVFLGLFLFLRLCPANVVAEHIRGWQTHSVEKRQHTEE